MGYRAATLRHWAEIASAAHSYIVEHSYDPTLSVQDVARSQAVSERTLQRALAHSGTDYSRELRIARMQKAARALTLGNTVAKTWFSSGYRSQAHFSRTFDCHYGITPRVYRRIAMLESRLAWREWNDKVRPVRPGSGEYFRRRKRRAENVRELQRLTRRLLPSARAALAANAPPPRPVIDFAAIRRTQESYRRRTTQELLRAFDDPW